MAKIGRQIMEGKGFCLTCHTIGKTRGRFGSPTSPASMSARRPASRA